MTWGDNLYKAWTRQHGSSRHLDVWTHAEASQPATRHEATVPSANLSWQLILPFPPTMNTLYPTVGRRRVLSQEGKAYHHAVAQWLQLLPSERRQAWPLRGRLAVELLMQHPTRDDGWDIQERHKALLDALQYAGVYVNDNQIDLLTTRRGPCCPTGRATVWLRQLTKEDIHATSR